MAPKLPIVVCGGGTLASTGWNNMEITLERKCRLDAIRTRS